MMACCSGDSSIAAETFMKNTDYVRRDSAPGHRNGHAAPFTCRGLT